MWERAVAAAILLIFSGEKVEETHNNARFSMLGFSTTVEGERRAAETVVRTAISLRMTRRSKSI